MPRTTPRGPLPPALAPLGHLCYLVRWDDGTVSTSDLRQHGWHLIGRLAGEPADIIAIYTRAQALADGELVDVSATAREAGFSFPVALTRAAWEDCVAWPESNGGLQDEAGRLWDVLWMLWCRIRAGAGGSAITYELHRVPNEPGARRPRARMLKALCGPGDHAEPVITIMLPEES